MYSRVQWIPIPSHHLIGVARAVFRTLC